MSVLRTIPTLPASPDARYSWTRYAHTRDTRPIALEPLTWHALREALSADASRYVEKHGPALSPGILRAGATRGGEAVERVEAIGLDIDGVSRDAWHALLDQLASARLAGITYSTFSHGSAKHGPDKVCARVLLPLSRPLDASPALDTPRLLRALNALLGGILDGATLDPSRLFFTPRRPEQGREHWIALLDGTRALDTDALLAMTPAPTPRAARPGGSAGPHASGLMPSTAEEAQRLAQASPEQRAAVEEAARLLGRIDASDRALWIACGHALARELGALGWPVWRDWSATADNADREHDLWARWSGFDTAPKLDAAGLHTLCRAAGVAPPAEARAVQRPQGARVLRPHCGEASDLDHAHALLSRAAEVALGAPITPNTRGPEGELILAQEHQLALAAGPLVLVSPPGTGKTHHVTRAVAQRAWAGERVLYVARSHPLREEVAHTLREAIASAAPPDAHPHTMPRVQLDAPRVQETCDGSPQTWPSLKSASRARQGGAAALCALCPHNPLAGARYGGNPCSWGRARDTAPASVEVTTHARYALWARSAGDEAQQLPLVWSWAALREVALRRALGEAVRVRPVLRATLETWRVEVEEVEEGARAWTPPAGLVWRTVEAVRDEAGEVMRAAHSVPADDTARRLRASIAAWWHLDDEALDDDGEVIGAAMSHGAARPYYDAIVIDEDILGECVQQLDLDADDIARAARRGILTGDTMPLQRALESGLGGNLSALIEGVSAPEGVEDAAWTRALDAWAQGDTIGAQLELGDAVPDTLGALWRSAAGTLRMYISPGRDGEAGRLHLRGALPLPSTLPRTAQDARARPLARRIVQLDATASPQVTRAIWGEAAMHYEIALARPQGVTIMHVEGDSGPKVWRGAEGHDASGARRAARAVHAAFDGPSTLHITLKRALDLLGPLEGATLHHNGAEARGSNAYRACERVVIDAWHVPRREVIALGEVLRALAGDDEALSEGWHDVARGALEDAPVQQALHRVRPYLGGAREVIWHNLHPPERALGPCWTADATVSASVLVWDVTGHARGPLVLEHALERAFTASPARLVTALDDADALREPERWGARRLDAPDAANLSGWRLERREQAQAIATALGARVLDVRSSAGGARFALTRAAEVTREAVQRLLDEQEAWSWCEVEGQRASRVEADASDRTDGLTPIYLADVLSDLLDAGAGRDELARELMLRCDVRHREAREAMSAAGGVEALRALREAVVAQRIARLDPKAAYERATGVSREVLAWHERELVVGTRRGATDTIPPAPPQRPQAFAADARCALDVLTVEEVESLPWGTLCGLVYERLDCTPEEAREALASELGAPPLTMRRPALMRVHWTPIGGAPRLHLTR